MLCIKSADSIITGAVCFSLHGGVEQRVVHGLVSESNAAEKTAEAWSAGIGYQFSTDKYIDLPTWFDSYASQVEEEKTTRS